MDFSRRAIRNSLIDYLNFCESNSKLSGQRPRYETYKKDEELRVLHSLNNRYKEPVYYLTFHIANSVSLDNNWDAWNGAKQAKRLQTQM